MTASDRIICNVKPSGDELFGAFTLHTGVIKEFRQQHGSESPITVVLTDHAIIERRAGKMREFWELYERCHSHPTLTKSL